MSTLYEDRGPLQSRQKVMLATPVYENPDSSYVFAISKSREALANAGILSSYLLLTGGVHVDDNRNTITKDFLETDCTDLVFLDADVSWQAQDLVKLCQYDLDIVGGVYPYRRQDTRNTSNKMPVRMKQGVDIVDGLLEVDGLPTGFLRIRRHVLETLAEDAPTFEKNGEKYPLIFERTVYNGQRMGGDINFCRKWQDEGGKLYAATEMRLGHVAKQVITDSLGASMRRDNGTSVKHMVELIRSNKEKLTDYIDVWDAVSNPWGAQEDILSHAVTLARKAKGPILETGSGLTTVLMAAATDQTVWCIEHSDHYAGLLEEMAYRAGVTNIAICTAPIVNGWYDVDELEGLPDKFSLALNDGPPRAKGDRMQFFKYFKDKCGVIICDDADNAEYAEKLTGFANDSGRKITFPIGRVAIIEGP